jgi:predicted cobalt transporter CbtA
MGRQAAVVLYVLALVAVVVGMDVLFFRNRFWERLMVNVGIVLVFAAFYLRFLKRPEPESSSEFIPPPVA